MLAATTQNWPSEAISHTMSANRHDDAGFVDSDWWIDENLVLRVGYWNEKKQKDKLAHRGIVSQMQVSSKTGIKHLVKGRMVEYDRPLWRFTVSKNKQATEVVVLDPLNIQGEEGVIETIGESQIRRCFPLQWCTEIAEAQLKGKPISDRSAASMFLAPCFSLLGWGLGA